MILIPNVGSAALLKEKELLAAAPTCSPASTLPTNHHVCLVFMSCTHGGGAYFEAKCGDSNLLEALVWKENRRVISKYALVFSARSQYVEGATLCPITFCPPFTDTVSCFPNIQTSDNQSRITNLWSFRLMPKAGLEVLCGSTFHVSMTVGCDLEWEGVWPKRQCELPAFR